MKVIGGEPALRPIRKIATVEQASNVHISSGRHFRCENRCWLVPVHGVSLGLRLSMGRVLMVEMVDFWNLKDEETRKQYKIPSIRAVMIF